MGAINKRGVWVPGAGDDLLASWQTMAGRLGVFVPVASVAAARALLDEAQAAGIGASTSNPITFQVGSGAQKVAYTADGSKSNNVWVLAPINEVEIDDTTYLTPWSGYKQFSVASGAYSNMMTSKLQARPYDRRVTASAAAYGKKIANRPTFRLTVHDGRRFFARFDADGDSASAGPLSFVIPANAAPVIQAGIYGSGSGTNTVELSGEENQNCLMVTAFPITMSA